MSTTAEFEQQPVPTHACVICGALWRFWPERDTGHPDSWNLRSNTCGPCCDMAPMKEQIQPLTIKQLLQWVTARRAVDAMQMHLLGPKNGELPS